MKRATYLIIILTALSCSDSSDIGTTIPGGGNQNNWLVPTNQVLDGGVGKDGIIALVNPGLIEPSNATYLQDEDLVVGYRVGDDFRAYPHKILDWHEIINDDLGSQSVAITYCPLTGTAIGWNRLLDGQITTFGVSGLLYNTNLIPYDRLTDSNWSQMRLDCINGNFLGDQISTYQVVETTWGTWKEMFPSTMVVSDNTGLGRPYGLYPYFDDNGADYRIDPFLIFPIEIDDSRLPRKQRVHGLIINGHAKVYPLSEFENETTLIEDSFQGTELIIIGDQQRNLVNSFKKALPDGSILDFTPVQNQLPAVLSDNEGNLWDIFGVALSGPRAGQKLVPTQSFIGFWFSWGTFYPGAEIYGM
ncbi:MAG: DUF3179 domain-containing protein [Cyclobacteriaceae bacterium]|nr:DUF3179 domain-containing protein [Cyclobacteriaceae bacterium]